MILKCFYTYINFILGDRVYAFDSRLGSSIRNLAKNARVVFDTIVLNQGLVYNSSTGVFRAPIGGIYVFDWTILAWEGLYAETALTQNGHFRSWNYCHPGKSNNWRSCSKMVILKLQKEDKVWITVSSGKADMHHLYSSFSGFKL